MNMGDLRASVARVICVSFGSALAPPAPVPIDSHNVLYETKPGCRK
jgi:hypothetical protein